MNYRFQLLYADVSADSINSVLFHISFDRELVFAAELYPGMLSH